MSKNLFFIDTLSSRLTTLNVPADDEAHQSVAYLRQLSRALKGSDTANILGIEKPTATSSAIAIGQASSPAYLRAVSSGTVVMDGLNSPVEIGSDPMRTMADFESPRSRATASKIVTANQAQHQRQQPNKPVVHVSNNPHHLRTGSAGSAEGAVGGARQKIIPNPTAPASGRPKLGAENELKEIFRPKPAVSSSGDD